MRKRSRTLGIGTVAEGDVSLLDLVESFGYDIARVRLSSKDRASIPRIEFDSSSTETTDAPLENGTTARFLLLELIAIAENYLPPFSSIIFREDRGPSLEKGQRFLSIYPDIEEARGNSRVVDDLADVPKGETGYVLVGNDHGNATLYYFSRGKSREIWSVV